MNILELIGRNKMLFVDDIKEHNNPNRNVRELNDRKKNKRTTLVFEDDDEEEFGLEDFDLSEFDDLPDYDQDESGLPEDDSKKKPDQKDQKK